MKELIFNIFLYVDNNIINKIGVVCHNIEGTDDEKLSLLKQKVELDFKVAQRHSLPKKFKLEIKGKVYNALNYDRYREMDYNGTSGVLFEEIFKKYNASLTPLMCITTIADGEVKIDGTEAIFSDPSNYPKEINEVIQPNFLDEYMVGNLFKLPDLINDDFFEAIRVTFNKKLYVSSIKLLMSCIDSLAFLEFGDTQSNFKKWLDSFVDLTSININTEELWEFRNSILHMTNMDSRKTINKSVSRIQFYVSKNESLHFRKNDEAKYFNYSKLITLISDGIDLWGQSFILDPSKIDIFIDRYERILSDKRYAHITIN
jgi:hypothetical protein